ncbi:hypothetical protein MJ1_0091 [Nanobdella aerobiophila]|uniref:Uncharacterized protein n=1 Tax=Nanobdella aerobiophila TaxID=2586965 RepID=A0A915WRW2_9ARCH|nr:hypothetical protein [Nanobdella aerobiophila]BBL45266.1 hypothetical protein MJ1_0091 [Nanobdella aerobiophila]
MVVLPRVLKIKRRYIILNNVDIKRFKKDYINFFGYIDYYKLNFDYITYNDFYIIIVNRKDIYKVIFILYLQNKKIIKVFNTLKQSKDFLNIF